MVLHRVWLSQGTELNTVTVFPEDHNMVYSVTVTNIQVLTQLGHHEQKHISENTNMWNTNTVQDTVKT
jgi:hypothetical protein